MEHRNAIADYLDIDLLARLSDLEFRAAFLVDGFLSGIHASPFRGRSVEFREHRNYHPGDEVSAIDWKAYARTDRLHVRTHEAETNLNAHILLDRSGSMNFRGPGARLSKWEYARSVAAALLLFLLRQQDAAALTLAGGEYSPGGKPSATESGFRRQLARLAGEAGDRDSDWPSVLAELAQELRPRSVVILISDFYVEPAVLAPAFDLFRGKNCEILLLHVIDPAEEEFPGSETQLLEECETGERLLLNPELIRESCMKAFREHAAALAELAGSRGGEYLPLRTDRVMLELFGAYLRLRAGRGRRR